MGAGEIIAIVVFGLLLAAAFYFGLKRKGPWGSFWSFFVVLVLAMVVAALWLTNVGPTWWGIAWVPIFFVGVLFALLLASATPRQRQRSAADDEFQGDQPKNNAVIALGWLFWLMIILFIGLIAAGAMR